MTDAVQKELARFREVITKDYGRTTWEGTATPLPAVTRLASVEIACRHFARGGDLPADELLRIAAEVTSLPLQEMKDADGATVQMWWPVRGEVGWLPYKERPGMWVGIEWEYDEFASRWVQRSVPSRPAISRVEVGA